MTFCNFYGYILALHPYYTTPALSLPRTEGGTPSIPDTSETAEPQPAKDRGHLALDPEMRTQSKWRLL